MNAAIAHPSADQLAQWNAELRSRSPLEITRWAVDFARAQAAALGAVHAVSSGQPHTTLPGHPHAAGRVVVSTNFRPYEAAVLHLATQVWAEIPVLWVDHGFNRPATYRHAEELRRRLGLNVRAFHPRLSAAHYEAVHGPLPAPDDEPGLQRFSALMKLEPFRRGMRELAPAVWITALRKSQNPNRAGLDILSAEANFGSLKVSPLFHHTDAELEAYLAAHDLPNEWDYFDPAKADEKRECGLHAAWGGHAVSP